MFEAVSVGHEIDRVTFEQEELELRNRILRAQRQATEQKLQTIIVIAGVEGAGKSAVVNRLRQWLDARGVSVTGFWDESTEETERPAQYRFWRAMPPRGSIGILFGAWYTASVIDRVLGHAKRSALESQLERIRSFEQALTDDGALIIKLWLHISKSEQEARLSPKKKRKITRKPTSDEQEFVKKYDEFVSTVETVIRHTDTATAPWYLIDAKDDRYRDLMAGRHVLAALEARVQHRLPASISTPVSEGDKPGPRCTVLNTIDMSQSLDSESYHKRLDKAQSRLASLAWKVRSERRAVIAVFEGWDAAGKGGAIRRVAQAVDSRMLQIVSIAAPTDEERAQHYLWRFWRHVPRAGNMTIFDRSWYGRVLVERVEGFAAASDWKRAYHEINEFEHELTASGILLCKFWLHISPETQLARFEDREETDYKRYKITSDDWRNRGKWDQYESAVDEMVKRTSTRNAPWTLVPADDKGFARVTVLETLIAKLKER